MKKYVEVIHPQGKKIICIDNGRERTVCVIYKDKVANEFVQSMNHLLEQKQMA